MTFFLNDVSFHRYVIPFQGEVLFHQAPHQCHSAARRLVPQTQRKVPRFSAGNHCGSLPHTAQGQTEDRIVPGLFKACSGALALFQVFMENKLQDTFSETVSLLKILITTPMTTAESERCFSTLKRIKTFLRNTMAQDRLNALAMLSMEKNLIQNIPDFNTKVIEKFATQKDRRAKFMYK